MCSLWVFSVLVPGGRLHKFWWARLGSVMSAISQELCHLSFLLPCNVISILVVTVDTLITTHGECWPSVWRRYIFNNIGYGSIWDILRRVYIGIWIHFGYPEKVDSGGRMRKNSISGFVPETEHWFLITSSRQSFKKWLLRANHYARSNRIAILCRFP